MNNAKPPAERPGNLKCWIIIGGIVLAVAVPVGIAIVGFTPAGVAAGSIAAGIQSGIGGAVAAGSPFAIFQSLGTMPLVGADIVMATGAGLGFFAHQYAVPWFSRIFGAMKDHFWTAVEVVESSWLELETLVDSQGKSKMQ